MKVKIIEITEVESCQECPNFDYEDGKGMCYHRYEQVEDEEKLDIKCKFRKKKVKK